MGKEYKTFIAEDGLLHCSNCGGALQRRLPTPLFGRDIFPTTCKCRAELYEKEQREQQERQHENTVKAYRCVCFHESEWRNGPLKMMTVQIPQCDLQEAM